MNDVIDHRVMIDGYYYWVMRINPIDAEKRGVRHNDLVRVYNDRGNAVFVADVSPLTGPGIVKTYESVADVDAYRHDKYGLIELAGCANVLTSKRPQQHGNRKYRAKFMSRRNREMEHPDERPEARLSFASWSGSPVGDCKNSEGADCHEKVEHDHRCRAM